MGHSFSAQYFNAKFARQGTDALFELYALPQISQLPALLKDRPGLCGLSVTIPHKISVMPYLQYTDSAAMAIGAVNCIKIKDGQLSGFNTDVIGFSNSLKPLLKKQHQKALVLGNGGVARAVVYVLNQLHIQSQIVSRQIGSKLLSYADITPDLVAQTHLIINTTPLGMMPYTNACPALPYEAMGSEHLLFDLVYNPEETLFMKKGVAQGAVVKNGLEMLYLQAEAAWAIWNS